MQNVGLRGFGWCYTRTVGTHGLLGGLCVRRPELSLLSQRLTIYEPLRGSRCLCGGESPRCRWLRRIVWWGCIGWCYTRTSGTHGFGGGLCVRRPELSLLSQRLTIYEPLWGSRCLCGGESPSCAGYGWQLVGLAGVCRLAVAGYDVVGVC